ncbi:hypothetical protein HDU97_009496 [Phlyctochytrium planicorne]|nr:hypothetical protein HDU97_009496 [Phlyctochytrium planicorne]
MSDALKPPTAFATTATPVPAQRQDGSTPLVEFSFKYPFIKTSKKARYGRWAIWFALAFVITAAILVPLAVQSINQNTKISNDQGVLFITPGLEKAGCTPEIFYDCASLAPAAAIIELTAIKFDPSKGMTISFNGQVKINEVGQPSLILPKEVRVDVDTKTFTAPPNSIGTFSFTSTYTVTTDPALYPYETYEISFNILASTNVNASNPNDGIELFELAVSAATPFALPSFKQDPYVLKAISSDPNLPGINVTLTFYRSTFTKIIVMFSWLLMHLWAIMVISLTGQVVFRDRDAMGFMIWTAASIFSMGTIRALQPASPPIGTLADVVTYIWGVAACSIMAFVLFCVTFRTFKPKTAWDKEFTKKEKASKWRAILKDEASLSDSK